MNTTTSHNQAMSLAHLKLAGRDLTAAHKLAIDAAEGLSGARHGRAVELAELVADALTFAERLSFIITADLRYAEQTDADL